MDCNTGQTLKLCFSIMFPLILQSVSIAPLRHLLFRPSEASPGKIVRPRKSAPTEQECTHFTLRAETALAEPGAVWREDLPNNRTYLGVLPNNYSEAGATSQIKA